MNCWRIKTKEMYNTVETEHIPVISSKPHRSSVPSKGILQVRINKLSLISDIEN